MGEIKGNNHTGSIYSLAFSKDSKKIITTSADATVKLWDIQTQQLISKCDFSGLNVGNDMQQVGALWTNDYIMSVSLNGEINYLDEATFTTPSRVIKV